MQGFRALSHAQYVLVNRLATPIGAFLILIVIGRHSDGLLGEYALVMTFYYIMQMLPLLGLTAYIMREVARHPEQAGKYFTTIGFLSLLGCVAVDLLCYGFIRIVEYAPVIQEGIAVTGLLIFPGILVFIAEIIFMSLPRARPVAQVAIVENIVRVLLSVTVLWRGGGLVELIWVFFATRCGAFVTYLAILKHSGIVDKFELPDVQLLRRTIGILPGFLIGALLFVMFSRMDFLVLSLFEVVDVIGYYAIGYRLFEIGIIVLTALIMALFPWISRKFSGADLHFRVAVKNVVLMFAVSLTLVCFAGILFAEYYVLILFTNQYPTPVLLTQLFMAALLISGMDFVASGVLYASDLQVLDTRAMAVGGAASLILLYALVPVYGVYGAFIAKVVATLLQGAMKFIFIDKRIGPLWRAGEMWRLSLVIGVVASLALLFMNAGVFAKGFAVLVVGLVILPALTLRLNLFQPLRLLRFYWRGRKASDVTGVSELIDVVVADLRRHKRCSRRHDGGRYSRRHEVRGLLALLLYRLSRFLYLQGRLQLALIGTRANRALTRTHIEPSSRIGPGWVLLDPQRISFAGTAGRNLTCIGNATVGTVAGNAGSAVLDDDITVESEGVVHGGMHIRSGTVIAAAGHSTAARQK